MAKYIVDGQKITNIANSIRNKKGVTTQFDIDEMPKEIDSLSKGGAKIITNTLEGTQIPSTGYIEKIYFNTSLNIDELIDIFSNLTYYQTPFLDNPLYPILFTTSGRVIFIEKSSSGNYTIINAGNVADQTSGTIIFASKIINGKIEIASFDISECNINENVINEYSGLPIGAENSKLKSLVSTTPFEEVTLEGEYDGSSVEITELKEGWKGTTVPTNEVVEKVYINTDLSLEETLSILESLNYVDYPGSPGMKIWACFTDTTMQDNMLAVIKFINGEIYGYCIQAIVNGVNIAGNNDFIFYWGSNTGVIDGYNEKGWLDGIDYIEFNMENSLSLVAPSLSFTPENEKVTSLFSTTPFVYTKANTINMKGYINNKQLPLEIKVPNKEVFVLTNDWKEGTTIPTSGTIKDIYVNTNLTNDEVVSILSKITSWYSSSYYLLFNTTTFDAIQINKIGSDYCIFIQIGERREIIFATKQNMIGFTYDFVGFNPDFNGVLSFNVANEMTQIHTTPQNELLTKLFSTTPFEKASMPLEGTYDGTPIEITENKVIDMKSYLDNKQLPLEVNVNIKGSGGVDIPSVSNITLNGSKLSWEAPDISELEQYKPIISYIVSVGENVLETTETSIKLTAYLVEGTNTVSVVVKAILEMNGNNVSEVVEYSKPLILDVITTMNATLPQYFTNASAVEIDNKAYILGGRSNSTYYNTIRCYDPSSDTITTMSTTSSQSFASAVNINNKAYIFGGYNNETDYVNTIQCYDPTNDTITTMNATLSSKRRNTSAVNIKNKAYIFGGCSGNSNFPYYNTIQCYDPTNDTITTMDSKTKISSSARAVEIDNKAYIFLMQYIQKYE